jgi:hypothetical protein
MAAARKHPHVEVVFDHGDPGRQIRSPEDEVIQLVREGSHGMGERTQSISWSA